MRRHDVHQLVDQAKWTSFHTKVLAWCFTILVLDGYDLAVAGAALPDIMKEMGINAASAGIMVSSALFGMMFGAVGLSWLSDRFGRRIGIATCVFFFCAFTAAAGFTKDPVTFSITRFLAGLGIGGAIPIMAAHMTEYAPKKIRGMIVTLMCCGYAVGSILAAVLGKSWIEIYGWQSVFLAAGAGLVLIPFVLKTMPESLPYLIKKGDDTHLRQVLTRMRPDVTFAETDQFVAPGEAKAAASPVANLFRDGRAFSTVMFWVSFVACLFMLYALSSWLVKLMATMGYSLGSALNFLLAYNAGAIVGAVGGGWLADKFNIKWVLFGFFLAAAVSLTALGQGVQPLFLVVAAIGASTLGTQILAYAYAGQYYPTSIKSTGVGFASGVGRIGAIAAPVVIGFLVSLQLSPQTNFMVIGAAGLIGAIAVALINHRLSASGHAQPAALAAAPVAAAARAN